MSTKKADRWASSWFERRLGPLNLFVYRESLRWKWQVTHRVGGDVGRGVERDEKAAKLEACRCAERWCAERWLLAKGKEAR